MEKYKQKLLNNLRSHIQFIQKIILSDMERVRVLGNKSIQEISKLRPEDQPIEMNLKANAYQRMEELEHLYKAPYFTKCEVVEENGEKKTYFFSKHQFTGHAIYSWFAPVASIRFENPGVVSYRLPSGKMRELELQSKEQYMIVDGKVIFFARETEEKPRELIYQEHFTKQKSEFILPEIVAQMEKAQDQVIRAHHYGSFIISGPAGSGKTTLALHRVAYLTQSPDTATLYPAESIVVFVQDVGTKEYFSQLLPELGIHKVSITTFSEWAMKILGLEELTYVHQLGNSEEEKDIYEYQKITALRKNPTPLCGKNIFNILSNMYAPYLTPETSRLFQEQRRNKYLDRFDLTILLQSHIQKHNFFEVKRRYVASVRGVIKNKIEKNRVHYSLITVDEFQNYLPEQLSLIKRSLQEETKSIIYVGDMAQQVYLGTIKNWGEINESVDVARNVRLDKVYRNTRSILDYLQSLKYEVTIPEGIKEGPQVTEKIMQTREEEVEYIRGKFKSFENGSVGILAKNNLYLELFRDVFKNLTNVHVMTMNESQGVEFDQVFLVGIDSKILSVDHAVDILPEHLSERVRIHKDLLYVALTRAITELHVLGKVYFKDLI